MGWARTILLGDVGNRLDIADAEGEIRSLKTLLRRKGSTDQSQDERLAVLESENEELKLCLSVLGKLLVAKGVVSLEELGRLTDLIDNDG